MRLFGIVGNMITKTATVKNTNGIHVRPSQVIAAAVAGYEGNIEIASDILTINDTNIMSIISMGLTLGDTVRITVDGPDETGICSTLVALFETEFDFPPRRE